MALSQESNERRIKKSKEKHGSDIFRKSGALGGKHRGRGYFGKLKAEDPEKFAELHQRAVAKARERNRKHRPEGSVGGRREDPTNTEATNGATEAILPREDSD